jgi:hypothetical protein
MKFPAYSQYLEAAFGIHLPMAQDTLPDEFRHNFALAMDAQPTLVSTPNGGVPAYLLNFLDPKVIDVLVTPMKAVQIAGEVKKGSWVDLTAQFPIAESVGEVAAYGDNSNNGSVGANYNWEDRQNYLYQTITQWGDLELERAGAGRIDHASRLNVASALTMNKFQNKSYFYGIAGLKNYGLLNDPSLQTPIAPLSESSQTLWANKDGAGVYADIQALYTQLLTQTLGAGDVDNETAMVLALSPQSATALTKTNQYNVNVVDQLKKNFPNLRIETAPEYATQSGNLMQLIVENVDGQQVVECAFSEKMRAHNVVRELSTYKQKKSGGTWGAIVYQPLFIAQMLGI